MDARPLLIVDLDGPVLDVVARYYQAHLAALAAAGATSSVAAARFWALKRLAAPPAQLVVEGERAPRYAAAFREVIERNDLLRLDRLQRGALDALAAFARRFDARILSLRTNVAGARAAMERLGISALVFVDFVPHTPEGEVPQARMWAAAHAWGVHAVIGDTEADAAAARAVDAPFWEVTCGIRTAERLAEEGAARIAGSLAELTA